MEYEIVTRIAETEKDAAEDRKEIASAGKDAEYAPQSPMKKPGSEKERE